MGDRLGIRSAVDFSFSIYHPSQSTVLTSLKFTRRPCLQPYNLEYTSSRLITEVKQGRAVLVL